MRPPRSSTAERGSSARSWSATDGMTAARSASIFGGIAWYAAVSLVKYEDDQLRHDARREELQPPDDAEEA
jgi:hypothetical protein